MHYSCIQSVLELIGTHAKDITSFCPSITLSAPEPDDPQDAVVAQQIQFVAIVFVTGYYLRDYQTFVGKARYWTETFAKTSSLGVEEKDLTLETKLVKIMDWREKVLGNKRVSLARVLWRNLYKKEEMWERESEIMEKYHFLEDK
ncbi:hypothetical protein NC652_037428 [Populus alba x Populus x berolinensis]|uniref:Uncharacterized protein n=1 Tax=Populus alba x Populus x berolinensis TaxID=444605 RepID=A0AAD6PRV3_9ROSI|nr:hypothetical protein NC652_037428 [Populus alba x Populus x berolinensis]KAJ6959021.1 hypothetical protein NC653_037339 [Populus alba x Populus x berolinensis]